MELERRQAARDRRQEWRVPVVCAVCSTVGGRPHLGQSVDIGPGGITVRRPSDLPVRPETRIFLTFDLPGTRTTLAIDGLVVSDRRHGSFRRTGIRFLATSPEQRELLDQLQRKRYAQAG